MVEPPHCRYKSPSLFNHICCQLHYVYLKKLLQQSTLRDPAHACCDFQYASESRDLARKIINHLMTCPSVLVVNVPAPSRSQNCSWLFFPVISLISNPIIIFLNSIRFRLNGLPKLRQALKLPLFCVVPLIMPPVI